MIALMMAMALMTQASEPIDKDRLKAVQKHVEQYGRLYEAMGSCAGQMTPDEVETALREAQQQGAAAGYLMAKYQSGFRHQKGQKWCHDHVGKAAARIPSN